MRPIDEDARLEVEMIAFNHLVIVGDVMLMAKGENPWSYEPHVCDSVRAELRKRGVEFVDDEPLESGVAGE
jgi:hypothetical protein